MAHGSFVDRLIAWWRRPGVLRARREVCMDDPDGALAELQEEQVRVAEELEATFLAFDRKLRGMAERLAAGDVAPSSKELARVRQEQLELWRLVRRAQAASRGTQELERELTEWSERRDVAAPEGHPDHPETRVEIIGSELRARGVAMLPDAGGIPYVTALSAGERRAAPAPEWDAGAREPILREIADRERELTRLLAAVESDPTLASELVLMSRELGELHGHLRGHA